MAGKQKQKSAKHYRKSAAYREIEADLLEQLAADGMTGRVYEDMVGEYMTLWVTGQLLRDDVFARGVSVEYQNGKDQSGMKRNDSLTDLVKVSSQKISILNALGCDTPRGDGDVL